MKLLLSLFLFSTMAVAQNHRKPIYFDCTCDDPVGRLWATKVRDLLATSPRYREVPSSENKTLYTTLSVVSVDGGSTGQSTAIAAALLIGQYDYMLAMEVQTCGIDRTQLCAEQTIAWLDSKLNP